MKKKARAGLSLIEIVISTLIITIGLGFSIRTFSTGRFFIQQSDNKAKAARIASLYMDRYLAKSFGGLEDLINAGQSVISGVDAQNPEFTYTVTLTPGNEVNASVVPAIKIPYIQLEVVVSYSERTISGGSDARRIRLVNIMPYPYYHIEKVDCGYTAGCAGNNPATCSILCPPIAPVLATSDPLQDQIIATITLTNRTRKNLLIIYNLGIQGVGGTGIEPLDILETQCYLDGVALPIRTGTPILTQPFISNISAANDIGPYDPMSPHVITIRWQTVSAAATAQVQLKWLNLIVLEIES